MSVIVVDVWLPREFSKLDAWGSLTSVIFRLAHAHAHTHYRYQHERSNTDVISVSAQQQQEQQQQQAMAGGEGEEEDKDESGGEPLRLCTEARAPGKGANGAATTRATQVCVDREARDGLLAGTLTNTGTAPLCGAALRVLAPWGRGPLQQYQYRHQDRDAQEQQQQQQQQQEHEAKRLSRAVPLVGEGEPPVAVGEGRPFVVEVAGVGMAAAFECMCLGWLVRCGCRMDTQWMDQGILWPCVCGTLLDFLTDQAPALPIYLHPTPPQPQTTTHQKTAVYGIMVDPDYSSCLPHQAAVRRLGDDAFEEVEEAGASAADIRLAKRAARKRRKEAKQATKGLEHKLKKVKKARTVGGALVKKGVRKWRRDDGKRAKVHAWQEKKRLRQQQQQGKQQPYEHKHTQHGPAAVGHKGLLAAAGEGESGESSEAAGVPGVRVGTIKEVVAADGGGGGDKGFVSFRGRSHAKRLAFKAARRAGKHMKRLHRVHKGGKGGKGVDKKQQP